MELCKDTVCDVRHAHNCLFHREKPVSCDWNLATVKVNNKTVIVGMLLIVKENGIILRDHLSNKSSFNNNKRGFLCRYLHCVHISKELLLPTAHLLKAIFL